MGAVPGCWVAASRMRVNGSERDERVHLRAAELLPAAQGEELDDEEIGPDDSACLAHQLARGGSGASGGEQIVDDGHLLALLHRVDVRLEDSRPVLEGVLHALGLVGELPELADGRDADAESIGERGAEKEPARLDGDDALEALAAQPPGKLVDDGAVGRRIAQHRSEVLEEDSRLGKIGNVADERADLVEGGGHARPFRTRPARRGAGKKEAAGPKGGVWD